MFAWCILWGRGGGGGEGTSKGYWCQIDSVRDIPHRIDILHVRAGPIILHK